MAIAEVATGGAEITGSTSTSPSVDATGGNVLVVAVLAFAPTSGTEPEYDVTYNGVTVPEVVDTGMPNNMSGQIFVLAGPASGSNTLSISRSAGDTANFIYGYAILSGASGSPDGTNTNTGSAAASPQSVSITTTNTDCFMYAVASGDMQGSDPGFAPSTNSTGVFTGTRGAGFYKHSGNPLGAPASESMEWTWSGNRNFVLGAVTIKEASFIPQVRFI